MTGQRTLALATLTITDAAPVELVQIAAAVGLDAVTLRIAPAFPGDQPPLADGDTAMEETERQLREAGVGVLDVEVLRMGPATVVADWEPAVERAARLGAEHLIVTNDDPDERRSSERFAQLCEMAAPRGIRPALEFMVFRATKPVEQAHRLVVEAEHPAGVVLVDALHLRRSGGTPADVARVAERAPERFTYFQLCDALSDPPDQDDAALRREGLEGRLLPGEGELPLRDLLLALPPQTAISIEAPVQALRGRQHIEIAQRAVAATRQLLSAID